jgi:hypothetical protein
VKKNTEDNIHLITYELDMHFGDNLLVAQMTITARNPTWKLFTAYMDESLVSTGNL